MTCFVRDSNGSYWLQIPHECVWGFALVSDDGLTLPGGFGSGAEVWHYVKPEEVPEEVQAAFAWLTSEHPPQ